jgi:hypothetical protein
MNAQVLINAVVRHTTVLIAQLATSGGLRSPLAHLANQVFLDLATELERQGVSRKVSADMFGLALRGYQRRVQRLTESSSARGRSLWEAVLSEVSSAPFKTRADLLRRFANDDEALVRGVLHDLVESGLLFGSGSGVNAVYRATTPDELGASQGALGKQDLDELVWVTVFREGPLLRSALQERVAAAVEPFQAALSRLVETGRLRESAADGEPSYSSGEFFIPLGANAGWAASVLDHFLAVTRTISAKLREGTSSGASDRIGGSTYTFVVWPGHPHEAEVVGELRRFREWGSALRARVDAFNREHGVPDEYCEVVSYAGQCTTERVGDELGADDDSF